MVNVFLFILTPFIYRMEWSFLIQTITARNAVVMTEQLLVPLLVRNYIAKTQHHRKDVVPVARVILKGKTANSC